MESNTAESMPQRVQRKYLRYTLAAPDNTFVAANKGPGLKMRISG